MPSSSLPLQAQLAMNFHHVDNTMSAWIRDLDLILPDEPQGDMKAFLERGVDNIPFCSNCEKASRPFCRTSLAEAQQKRCTYCVHKKESCDAIPYTIYRLCWMLVRLARGLGQEPEPAPLESFIELPDGSTIRLFIDAEGRPRAEPLN